MESPGAIVIGGYVNGLGLVRSLAARGIRTTVVRTQPFDIAHRSRLISAHDSAFGIVEEPEVLVDLLERRAREWSGCALFPTNDEALAAVIDGWDRLASSYRIVAPDPASAPYILDKGRMLDAAEAVGMDLPYCYGPATEATAALPDLRFPVLVKPVVGYRFYPRFGTKLFLADDLQQLNRSVALVNDAGIPCQVFDLVPGADDQIYVHCTYVGASGEPSAGVTVRKLRQAPPLFGVARVAEIAPDRAQMREAVIELLRRIGFRGMAIVEFKLDPRDGTFRFLEINGRAVVTNGLLRRGGLDLAGLAWSDYVIGRPEVAHPNGWPGVWINTHADLLYALFHRSPPRVGLAEFIAPYRRPKVFAAWSATDPGPAIAQWTRTFHEGVTALRRGTHRERVSDRSRLPTES